MGKVDFAKKESIVKSNKKRVKRLDLRCSEQELDNIDFLIKVLHKRRNLNKSRMDLFVYLVEKEITYQDKIRIVDSCKDLK